MPPSPEEPGALSGLLVDADKQHARSVARVLRSIVPHVDTVERVEDAPARAFDLVLLNYDALDDQERARSVQRFCAERDRGRLVLCSAVRRPEALSVLFGELGVRNMLGRHEEVDGQELLITVQKILRDEIFGIEKYFPWGASHLRFTLDNSGGRDAIREQARALAEALGTQSRMVELFCTVVDELTTNAIYNAPIDEHGAERFSHLKRGEPVSLQRGEGIEVVLSSDGRTLGCAVSDPFGSLGANTIVDYLGRCFRRGDDQISDRSGGAGLGLFTVYESCSQLVVNIDARRRTEMIGLIDIRGRFRDFAERPKSFNVFVAG